jgi:hypothetical protein
MQDGGVELVRWNVKVPVGAAPVSFHDKSLEGKIFPISLQPGTRRLDFLRICL